MTCLFKYFVDFSIGYSVFFLLICRSGLCALNTSALWVVILILLNLSIFPLLEFPGGAVVKNPPANAGDMGSSSGLGRFHMPWSN